MRLTANLQPFFSVIEVHGCSLKVGQDSAMQTIQSGFDGGNLHWADKLPVHETKHIKIKPHLHSGQRNY